MYDMCSSLQGFPAWLEKYWVAKVYLLAFLQGVARVSLLAFLLEVARVYRLAFLQVVFAG